MTDEQATALFIEHSGAVGKPGVEPYVATAPGTTYVFDGTRQLRIAISKERVTEQVIIALAQMYRFAKTAGEAAAMNSLRKPLNLAMAAAIDQEVLRLMNQSYKE